MLPSPAITMIFSDIIHRMIMHSGKNLKVGLRGFPERSSIHAVKRIEKGEIVLTEEPCLSYPDPGAKFGGNSYEELESYYILSQRPTNIKLCVSCYSCLDNQEFESCEVCCSPICSSSCQNLPNHALSECQILEYMRRSPSGANLLDSSEVQDQIFYDLVAVIRVLLLKLRLKYLSKLTSNISELLFAEDRYRTGPFAEDRKAKIEIYTSLFQCLPSALVNPNDQNSQLTTVELVNHCFNILSVIKLGVPQSSEEICYSRNLYWLTSFIRHSCIPNVDITTDKYGQVKVKALQAINEGEDLVYCFVNILRPTYDRHIALQVQRLTECCCQRCLDPTEFETYLGSVKCESIQCCGSTRGFLVMDTVKNIQERSNYNEWIWKCINCSTVVSHSELVGTLDGKAADMNKWSPKDQVNFDFVKAQVDLINHRYSTFHPGHWLPLLLHEKLAGLMGLKYEIWNWGVDPSSISQKINILTDLLQVYVKLQCALTPFAAKLKVEILGLSYARMKSLHEGIAVSHATSTSSDQHILYRQAVEIFECVNHVDSSSKYGDVRGMAHLLIQKLRPDPSS